MAPWYNCEECEHEFEAGTGDHDYPECGACAWPSPDGTRRGIADLRVAVVGEQLARKTPDELAAIRARHRGIASR